MQIAEAVEEAGVVDEAAPVLADERGAEEVDRLRREAQEYLLEETVPGEAARRRPPASLSVPPWGSGESGCVSALGFERTNKITGPWFKLGRVLCDFQLRLAGAEGICSQG